MLLQHCINSISPCPLVEDMISQIEAHNEAMVECVISNFHDYW